MIAESERIILRKLEISDAAFIFELLNTELWKKNIGDRHIHQFEDAIHYILNGPVKSYVENGFGLWGIELKEKSELIGMCGLLKRDFLLHPDIGFAILPQYNNKGYGYEAANLTVKLCKEQYKLPMLLAITLPQNNLSIRLLEKLGMQYKETIHQYDENLAVYFMPIELL